MTHYGLNSPSYSSALFVLLTPGTFGIGLQQAMGETLSDSNSISCSGVSAFNQSTTFNLLSEIQTRIQANLYGTSSIYGYMNSILNVYNLQCCDSFSGCNQAVGK
jgi:hypothetical protein